MRLTQLSGAAKRMPVRGSRSLTLRPGSRTRSGSGGASGLVPQPARNAATMVQASQRGIRAVVAGCLRGGARMRAEVDLFQMIRREVGVELGRRHVRVAEHLLDRSQVASARQ